MELKTEYNFNEDDFIQTGDDLKELTVTITLCEYRNLLTQAVYDEKSIEKLQEENEHYRTTIKAYSEILLEKNPDIADMLFKLEQMNFGRKGDENDKKGD